MSIEEYQVEVMKAFEEQTGMKALSAYPVYMNQWMIIVEGGEQYIITW